MPLYPPSECQISRQSDKAFASNKVCEKRKKIRRKITKKLSQFLKSHISRTLEAILLKFGIAIWIRFPTQNMKVVPFVVSGDFHTD